jgi:hypothetical protein
MPRIIAYPYQPAPRLTDFIVLDSADRGTEATRIQDIVGAKELVYRGRAALKAETVTVDRQKAYLDYLLTEDDGQGGTCTYRAASTATPNDLTVFLPDGRSPSDPGRWHLSLNQS